MTPGKLKGEKKIIRRKLRRNKNVEIIDDYKLYDHSKYFLVDDYGYVGGANIADEYNIGEVVKNGKNKGKRERPWQDHYTRIRGGKEYNRLVRVLTGEATKDLKVVEDIFLDKNEKNFPEEDDKKLREEMHYISDSELQKTGSSIDQFTLDFLDATKESLYVQLPYLGNRDYRIKIIELIKRGVKVFLVIPKNPNVNIWRNQHFLKDVYLWGDEKDSLSKLLSIFSLEGMNHTKMFVRDPYDEDNRAVEAGSHNGSLNTRRLSDFFKRLGWAFPKTSFNETNYVTGNKDVVDQQMKSFKKNISEGALVVPSVEYLENVGKIIDHFKEGEEDGVGDKVEEIVKENDKQKNKFSIFCRKLKEKVLFHLNRKNREKAVEFLESKDNSNNWLNIIKEKIEGEKVMFLEPWWSIFARSRAEWFGGVLQNFFYGFKKKEIEKRRDEAQEAIARLVKNKWGGSSRE